MRYLFSAALVLFSLSGFCQLFAPADYPRNYFRDPLAIPMSLAANFGELRPNHYHMGLDIRTQHRENLPVYAAADGYVARVSIEPSGFGQAVYINHPNGYTTVYGHLNRFFPALAAYIHKEQYRRRSWQVYLELPPSLFPVHKGDVIAYSGNTGGSQGPHLHFEIRRTAGDVNLNPLLFGLPVPDNTAPTIQRLAWYDRSKSVYEQLPHLLPVLAQKNNTSGAAKFTIGPSLLGVPVTHISFALGAFDTQSGSANPNGIFEADLFMDERLVIGFQMDKISYDNTRNINAHIDYKTRNTGGPFLQHLSFLSGYPLPSIYAVLNGVSGRPADPAALVAMGSHPPDGVLDIGDGRPHAVCIEVRDTYGNTARLSFLLQYKPAPASADVSGGSPAEYGASPASTTATSASPAARNGFVDTASVTYAKRFYPGMVDGLETPGCAFYLGEKSLYDSATIATIVAGYPGSGRKPIKASSARTDFGASLPGGVSPTYAIGEPWIPLLEPVLVRMQYPRVLPTDLPAGGLAASVAGNVDHIVMVCFTGADKDVQRPEWHEGWASARFRSFGDFQLVEDRTPPVITPLQFLEGANLASAARIAFSVKDDLGALRDFTAELDGAWLCFTNDKAKAFIYTFDEHCPPGMHTLKVTATDVAGNKTVKEYHFTR
jgi:Peptidase family M23